MNSNIYRKLDEGMGGAYERIAFTNVVKDMADRYRCRKLLELDATYIAGIPGFNSCVIAQQDKYDVSVAVQPRDYPDAKHVWELTGLIDRVRLYQINTALKTHFRDGQFDVVWNHLSFELYKHPEKLVSEMARISSKVVINLTLNPYNYGYIIHWINHKLRGEPWDHGKASHATIGYIKKVHKSLGLKPVAWGQVDAPPWMDTVNAIIGNSMTYSDIIKGKAREKWTWCCIDPKCQEHKLTKLFLSWERDMPYWFRMLAAHHLYVVSVK